MNPIGSIVADPNPIQLTGGNLVVGVTTLSWTAEGVEGVELHVGAPDGPLVSRKAASGGVTTGRWVRDGMVFYLQDISAGKPLAPAHTLDTVEVRVERDTNSRDHAGRRLDTPPVGHVRFGDLRRVHPISQSWGLDRGLPIDRHYIEKFLSAHSEDIHGQVLEVGDDNYTRRFGAERVTKSDVLNLLEGSPGTTIVADLQSAPRIGSRSFDCIILTQTLQCIYDVRAAIRTLHRILRPSGVLLVTLPGISQTYDAEWGESWCWNFTVRSARKLFEQAFAVENVEVQFHGNVLASIAFLQGLAAEELREEELNFRDQGYQVTITVRATKLATLGSDECL